MFTNLIQIESFFKKRRNFGIKPGLDRVQSLLQSCGYPEKKIKTVHVAGTNGKGSTIHYMNAALLANNYRVGIFSSPSLDGLTGHITINNEKISSEDFIRLLNRLYPMITHLDERENHPTKFEIITVLSFLFFYERADIALIEVGMGGRDDTTNCIDPLLSIITTVEYDHTDYLGDTIEEISDHKSGIIKQGRPVVIGDMQQKINERITRVAAQSRSSTYKLFDQFTYQQVKTSRNEQCFTWINQTERFNVTIQQLGNHQVKNCSIALKALSLLRKQGMMINMKQSLQAISLMTISGRFEKIQNNPPIIVDGAHNVAAVHAFIKTIETHYQDVEKILVFAAFKDKEIEAMLHELKPHFTKVILTTFDHARAATLKELQSLLKDNHWNVKLLSWEQLKRQLNNELANYHNPYCFFTGSLHFIKEIKNIFEIKKN